MEPSWRKPAGMIGLLCYLGIYAGVVVQFADALSSLPKWLELVAYLILGVAWIAPLKPLFLWMNTGHWRLKK
jgi:predicted membrane channel-forming protein YqfA (hemolysin III family)